MLLDVFFKKYKSYFFLFCEAAFWSSLSLKTSELNAGARGLGRIWILQPKDEAFICTAHSCLFVVPAMGLLGSEAIRAQVPGFPGSHCVSQLCSDPGRSSSLPTVTFLPLKQAWGPSGLGAFPKSVN